MGGKAIKYRLQIPMEESTRASLKRLSDVTGDSMGSLAGHYLDEFEPQIRQLADALEKLKTDPRASAMGMHLMLAQAQRDAIDSQVDLFHSFTKLQDGDPDRSDGSDT